MKDTSLVKSQLFFCVRRRDPTRAGPDATRWGEVAPIDTREISAIWNRFRIVSKYCIPFLYFLSRWANTGAYKNQNTRATQSTRRRGHQWGSSWCLSLSLSGNGDPIDPQKFRLGAPKCTLVKTHMRQSCPRLLCINTIECGCTFLTNPCSHCLRERLELGVPCVDRCVFPQPLWPVWNTPKPPRAKSEL